MDPFVKANEEKALRNSDVERYKNLMVQATALAEKRLFNARDMDAVYLLFAQKLHWTPAEVRSMTFDELVLIFDNIVCK